MSTQELLKAIAQHALDDAFHREMEINYEKRVAAGDYGDIELEYKKALEALLPSLTPDKQTFFSEYENTCSAIRKYSASYGFIAGLFCGFKQFFTEDQQNDGGFDQYVFKQIAMMPQMTLHTENYYNIQQKNKLYCALKDEEANSFSAHLVTIECAWSQRAYSASIDGFYSGYHGALAIIDKMMPLGDGCIKIIRKQMTMTHYFGFI